MFSPHPATNERRLRRFAAALLPAFFFLTLTACETVGSYVDEGLALLGLADAPAEKPAAKKPQRPSRPVARPKAGEPAPKEPAKAAPASDSDIIISKTDVQQTRKVEKKDLKSAEKPEFRVEAPVDVQKRVGGAARLILSDSEYVYLDFPQHFAVYDPELNFLARIPLAFPLRELERFKVGDKTYLYLTEEKDVLEILELVKTRTPQGDSYALNEVTSYEVGGRFAWLDAKTLLIFLKDKLQFLDFSRFNEVKIINEVPVRDVTAALPLDKYLYLARKGFLDILDGETFKTLSSMRVGKDFDFLGVAESEGRKDLLLTLPDGAGAISAVQYLRVTDDFSGVTDFGPIVALEKPLRRFFADLERGLIVGEEVGKGGSGPVRLFSLDEKRFLRGELGTRTNLLAWSMNGGNLHLVTPLDISVNALSLDVGVIEQAPQLQKLAEKKSPQVPLAQIGAAKTVKDEYALSVVKRIEFMADARKVALLDGNHFAVFEYRATKGAEQIFTTTEFKQDNFTLAEPGSAQSAVFTKLLSTDYGLLAYAEALKKIFFMGVDLNEMQTLPVEPETLLAWTNFTSPQGEILILSCKLDKDAKGAARKPAPPPAPKPETEPVVGLGVPPPKPKPVLLTDGDYAVKIYLLKSPQEAELLSQIYFNEKPFALPSMENEIMIVSGKGIVFYNVENMREPILNEIDKFEFPEQRDILSVKPFLIKDRVYSLVQEKERLKILAFSATQPNEQVLLEDFDITREQFDGSSFSKGGQLFILPTTEGTLFYDMTELHDMPEDRRIVAHWDFPSYWVDVAAGGRFICVALGAKGVYCGDLLFY